MALRPRVTPLSQKQRLKEAKMRRAGVHMAPGVHAPSDIENWYRKQLDQHIDRMKAAIEEQLLTLIRKNNDQFTTVDAADYKNQDGFMDIMTGVLNALRGNWEISNTVAKGLASNFVGKVDAKTQAAIESAVGNAMGVDLVKILSTEGLTNVVEAGIAANIQLITSIPRGYLDKIEMIITQEGTKGRTGASLIQQIQEVYPVTKNRARVIARDQTSKLNGGISRQRQVAAGIRGYRWRTVGDNAVRESHKERNGKFYAWNPEDVGKKLEDGSVMLDPEADDIGNPGEDYQCRCIAEAVLELDRLL